MKMKEFQYKVYVYNIKRTTYNGEEEEYTTEVEVGGLFSSPEELLRFHQNIGDTNIQVNFIKEKEKIGYSIL